MGMPLDRIVARLIFITASLFFSSSFYSEKQAISQPTTIETVPPPPPPRFSIFLYLLDLLFLMSSKSMIIRSGNGFSKRMDVFGSTGKKWGDCGTIVVRWS